MTDRRPSRVSKRNAIADLRTPKYRVRVIPLGAARTMTRRDAPIDAPTAALRRILRSPLPN